MALLYKSRGGLVRIQHRDGKGIEEDIARPKYGRFSMALQYRCEIFCFRWRIMGNVHYWLPLPLLFSHSMSCLLNTTDISSHFFSARIASFSFLFLRSPCPLFRPLYHSASTIVVRKYCHRAFEKNGRDILRERNLKAPDFDNYKNDLLPYIVLYFLALKIST